MSGNTIGKLFCLTSFGESHGPGIGGIVDGCPPGLALSEADLQYALDKRKPGQSPYVSQRKEPDTVQILSGVFQGKTTGTPIMFYIANQDAKTKDYEDLAKVFRPGHADYTYQQKYQIRDHRGGGRASARETAVRVAAGAIAQKYLQQQLNLEIYGYITQIGELQFTFEDKCWIEQNPFFIANQHQVAQAADYLTQIRKQQDSIGAKLRVIAKQVPVGLGEPVYDKLDADIAKAMMSINAVKAVSIGDGFAVVNQRGSEHRDAITTQGFVTNHAGGILGGISSGQDIIVDVALKPTSSIPLPISTLDMQQQEQTLQVMGRHDPCVGIRAVPIAQAMLALTLMDHYLRFRGQCGERNE